jgi:thioester reductase-like protein
VPADLQQPGLGLSEQDEKRLLEEVHFVIHSAASISFFEHVHTLLNQNYVVSARTACPFHCLVKHDVCLFLIAYSAACTA